MRSNIERIYNHKDEFDILNRNNYLLSPNPFFQVHNFINSINKDLNSNFLMNLNDLKISKNKEDGCSSNYDYKKNVIYSKDSKSDVFALLHVASNNRQNKYTGIITKEGVGYGLNNGLTDYYANMINGKKIVYPIEALAAKIIDMIYHGNLVKSYFKNNSEEITNVNIFISKLMELVDTYHDNYIELMECYMEKFNKERYYYNAVYGKFLKEKNIQLQELYNKIHKLEYNNYALVEDIYFMLIDIIEISRLCLDDQNHLINLLDNEIKEIIKKENFSYLNNLVDTLESTHKGKKLTKWKR